MPDLRDDLGDRVKPFPKPNIVTVYEHYGLRLIGADRGGWRKAECPLPDHEDRNPSASINEDACRWHCHTCDTGGDAVDIVRVLEGLDTREAVEFINKTFEGDLNDNNSGGSSLMPRPSGGSRPGRKNWTAPWTRL